MVVTAATETIEQIRGSLRPLNPVRDLKAVTNLIASAFADEMDARSRAALREMRWMARLSPLVWWWSYADPGFRDAFNGFVWEEPSPVGRRRQVVGNVSLNRALGSRQRYVICNVVVHEAYRGHGIGGQLTEAAVVEAKTLGAAGIVLQVYEDNPHALQMYTGLGFREAAGEIELRLEAVQPVAFLDAPGYHLRSWRPADGEAAFQLARLVTPQTLQWLRPVKAEGYRLNWLSHLVQSLAGVMVGRRVYRLVALKEGRLVAMMTVTATLRQWEHELSLLVHPDHAGQVEAAMVSRALHLLAAAPPRPVRVTVFRGQKATLDVLRGYGFRQGRTLLTLRKDFR